ncbi:MAG: YhjD/YihY/BrkB family envelope integrity protein [Rubripirellula sp.]
MTRLFDYLLEAVRSPREQLSRGQQFVRQSAELAVHCYRQLQRQRAEGMAAELTYRTIFALIPVVVLGLVMFRIVGGLEDVQGKVENQLFSFFGVPEIPEGYMSDDRFRSKTNAESESETGLEGEDGTLTPIDGTSSEETEGATLTGDQESIASGDTKIEADSMEGGSGNASGEQSNGSSGVVETQPASESKARANETNEKEATTAEELDGVASVDSVDSGSGEASGGDDVTSSESVANDAEAAARGTRASIRKTLHDLTDKVASVDFASIGVFGLLLFVYAAVALADAVEHLFNRIYDAPAQRPIHIRLAIHWSIITLGSGLLAMSLYMSGQVVDWFDALGAGSTVKWVLSHILSAGASWVLLFLLYALMPNTHVSVKAAAIGSAVGSLLWEGAKFGFQLYVAKAVPYSLYGSIGLIPLFLFWIYITWLIVLFGLILTYTLQSLGGRLPRQFKWDDESLTTGDPDWMLPIMCEVGHAFSEGKAINPQDLADQIGLSSRIVNELTTKLVEADMLRKVTVGAAEDESLTLARPAEKIEIGEILELAHRVRPTSDHPAWKTLSSLKRAERDAAVGKTLADVQSW